MARPRSSPRARDGGGCVGRKVVTGGGQRTGKALGTHRGGHLDGVHAVHQHLGLHDGDEAVGLHTHHTTPAPIPATALPCKTRPAGRPRGWGTGAGGSAVNGEQGGATEPGPRQHTWQMEAYRARASTFREMARSVGAPASEMLITPRLRTQGSRGGGGEGIPSWES
jgi:hypothetical protein